MIGDDDDLDRCDNNDLLKVFQVSTIVSFFLICQVLDLSAGVEMLVGPGDRVEKGQVCAASKIIWGIPSEKIGQNIHPFKNLFLALNTKVGL